MSDRELKYLNMNEVEQQMVKKTKPAEEDTELVVIESTKRVAVDGSQRGLHRKGQKAKKTTLLENIQAAIVKDHDGDPGWDPVVMMAVIASRAHTGYPAVDDNGQPVVDEETGIQVMVPPNPELALVAAAKVAPFLHGHVRPKEPGADDNDSSNPDDKKDLVLAALENMGVEVTRDE